MLAAYTATTNAKTASFRLDAAIQAKSVGGSSQSATITGSGQVDFAAKAFTLSVNAPSGGTIKILLVNGTEYLRVPAAARSQIPGHKAWVSVNLNKVSQARLGATFSQRASAARPQNSPGCSAPSWPIEPRPARPYPRSPLEHCVHVKRGNQSG